MSTDITMSGAAVAHGDENVIKIDYVMVRRNPPAMPAAAAPPAEAGVASSRKGKR